MWTWSFGCQVSVLGSEERWEEVLKASQECFERLGYRYKYSEALAYMALDRREELEGLIRAGLLDDIPNLREPLPWIVLIRALTQAYLGERERAETSFEQAITSFETRGSRIGLARALYGRAMFWQSGGRAEPALADAERSEELFRACGAKQDEQKAKALASALRSSRK